MTEESVEQVVLPFQHPCSIILAGPSKCGKTEFMLKVMKEQLIQPFASRIIVQYGEWQKAYDTLKTIYPYQIEFTKTFDEATYRSLKPEQRNIVVLDDQMLDGSDSAVIARLFVQGSHHRNLSVIFMLQNLYHPGKFIRDITRNTDYFVLFRSPRDL